MKSHSQNQIERICLIVNPRAAAGKAGKQQLGIEDSVNKWFANWEIRITKAPGHASQLAAEACQEGFDIVAAVGGDGTCHEVVNGMIKDDQAIRSETVLSIIPIGTGSDLIKTIKTPKNVSAALSIAANGPTKKVDVG